ncbi:MAG: transposase zinc-binding domain-containing protein [Gammaproteobacteria bacterium]|nr:transposase zinc-binding domain-containing protein [Gammaproteobacteria bacterium]MBQ0838534.1 transposase zinc-binding domain-containing protein [Gammaproteobacteria bacterium]
MIYTCFMASFSIQNILQQHLSGLLERNKFTLYQYRALKQLSVCRTAKLGGHAQYCAEGHLNGIWYNSCKHRACPQCRGLAGEEWRQNTESMLLNCPHHHVIFTLPEELNILWRYNRALMTSEKNGVRSFEIEKNGVRSFEIKKKTGSGLSRSYCEFYQVY